MPQGDKSKYTDKQERKADHIAESYEDRGISEKEAERRAWATVNKDDGGGKKAGDTDKESIPVNPQPTKGARRAERLLHRGLLPIARRQRRKLQQRGNGMRTTPTIRPAA